MKLLSVILLLFLSFNAYAQKAGDILATANGRNYTVADLEPEARQEYENLPKTIANLRQTLLEEQINNMLLEREAAQQKITIEKLIEREVRLKIPAPTDAQIKAVYDANPAAVGNKTLEEIRPQIIAYLRREPEQRAFDAYISDLKIKHKAALGKDVNAANLSRLETLATVGDKQISAENFETQNKPMLSDIEADVYAHAREAVEQIVFSNLLVAEAKAQNIETSDFIAREITDKLKEFSAEERAGLETALRDKLFAKYNAKFTVKQIAPVVLSISTDDDPAQGKATAPVTVVMFTDFQCPGCAGTHPALKKVLAEFGDKVRFVVRDFPLVTIHANAFQAAVAAGAANTQGKFYEYIEFLYKNQNALDEVSLKRYAADLGLNMKQFEADLANPKIADEIRKDMADGKSYGISGTPTVFVNGVKVRHLSPDEFKKAINKALKEGR